MAFKRKLNRFRGINLGTSLLVIVQWNCFKTARLLVKHVLLKEVGMVNK